APTAIPPLSLHDALPILAIDFAEITGRYEGPQDRIFEVMLESGRSVRVTAGHNLFVRSETGGVRKARTAEVITGAEVAVPPAERSEEHTSELQSRENLVC